MHVLSCVHADVYISIYVSIYIYMHTTLGSSLPQGDNCSMIAMAGLLLPATPDVKNTFPRTVLVIYADDRTFSCSTARELVRNVLGLKMKTKPSSRRRQVLAMGLRPLQVTSSIRVLGYTFSAVTARQADYKEMLRLADAGKLQQGESCHS